MAATGGLLFGYDVGVISVAQLQLQKQLGLSCTAREAVVSCMMAGALLASAVGGENTCRYCFQVFDVFLRFYELRELAGLAELVGPAESVT